MNGKIGLFITLLYAFGVATCLSGTTIDLSGAGWTVEFKGDKRPAVVPTTTEAVFADLSDYAAPDKDMSRHNSWIVKRWMEYKGKSVWSRDFEVNGDLTGKRVFLTFERTRYFADIIVNGVLCHHDEAPDMPYEVDVTKAVKPGKNLLEVKIDNPPGGDYDWRDYMTTIIDDVEIPGGRAFGGVQGKVMLDIRDSVYIDDLWIRNTPDPKTVVVQVTVVNAGEKAAERKVAVEVAPKGRVIAESRTFAPGETVITQEVKADAAKLWDIENPNLYTAVAQVGAERVEKEFGYRWFEATGIGEDAMFRLNGKRIVIRTAIGWGWYLGSGTVPSDEDAKREVAAAKALGQNGISFHRHNGQENILREADRQGLLIYAEPGAFQSGKYSDRGMAITTERVKRYVKAFRSHPSLFHWNLMNELTGNTNAKQEQFFADSVRLVHQLDPSRNVTLTSAWAQEGIKKKHLHKMHMRTYDDNLYMAGWYDFHHATGPVLPYGGRQYESSTKYYNNTKNREEIVYWGEEGAFTAPPRLQLILDELDRRGDNGADGQVFRVWAKKIEDFIVRKDLRGVFPTLDSFCVELSRQSMLHQGRKIELCRATDVADGYAVNGWESMAVENNSGIVDTMRNPKGDPAIMRKYNAPLKLAVYGQPNISANNRRAGVQKVDVWIINEKDVKGPQKLVVEALVNGKVVSSAERDVTVTGGDKYGELLAEKIELSIPAVGRGELRAKLVGVPEAVGDFPFNVFYGDTLRPAKGVVVSVCETGDALKNWFAKRKWTYEAYDPAKKSDVIIVARPPTALPKPMGGKAVKNAKGEVGKIDVKWSEGKAVKNTASAPEIALDFPQGAPPAKGIESLSGWSVEVSGTFVAQWTGEYRFLLEGPKRKVDRTAFEWNGKGVALEPGGNAFVVELKAGEEIPFVLKMTQKEAQKIHLLAQTPEPTADFDPKEVLAKAKADGSRVIILEAADQWAKPVAEVTGISYRGRFDLGRHWLGGCPFVKDDPLFEGFPTNGSCDESYEDILSNANRYALMIEGEKLVMGAWQSENSKLGTMVGRIPQGKGEIILSTLEVLPKLGRLGSDRYLYNLVLSK